MMKPLSASLIALALAMPATLAGAQNMLSTEQIVESLRGVEREATLNPQQLRDAALQNIKRNPGENAPKGVPMVNLMENLRQFNVEINFDFDSDRIKPDSFVAMGAIADALHTPYLLHQKFLIVGHTDARGTREYNLGLSQRRADAVREALVTTFRVPPESVQAVGLGEEDLRDPANPDAAVNRRVQLINTGF